MDVVYNTRVIYTRERLCGAAAKANKLLIGLDTMTAAGAADICVYYHVSGTCIFRWKCESNVNKDLTMSNGNSKTERTTLYCYNNAVCIDNSIQ